MPARLIRFGVFELNTGTRELHKQGRRVKLQEQPLRILEILLERPGELVTRQELRERLWPSDVYVNFELGLTGAIKRLRLALSDSADNPVFIETVPKSGYRFLAPVQVIVPAVETSVPAVAATTTTATAVQAAPDLQSTAPLQHRTRAQGRYLGIALSILAAILVTAYLLRPVAPLPQVTRIVKLSNTGHAWVQESFLYDGARLYYTEFNLGSGFQLRQILLNGNEDTVLKGLPPNTLIRGLSPDHTTFLAVSRTAVEEGHASPVWMVPVIGGPARRVGNLLATDIAWSPDGSMLAFTRDGQLYTAHIDGTGEHMLASVPGGVVLPRWSPDGERLRFTVEDSKAQFTIWEVRADGRNPHQLDFNWPGAAMESYGEWTADGRFYVFSSRRDGMSNLWAIEEKSDWLHRSRSEPVQLTAGPMNYYRPLPNLAGTQIFALGLQPLGELLRYDQQEKDFVRYLGGKSADHLEFTADGKWIAYISYPEGTLWRARSDGSQQLQLTFAPMRAFRPRWSPDGKRLLFVVRGSGELPKIYTISIDGGDLKPLVSESHAQTAGCWSPDGNSIIYGRDPDQENEDLSLYRADAKTGHTERIPGTENLYAPVWSPDGRSLAALSLAPERTLVMVDLNTGKRTLLTKRKADYATWSADSQYIYFNSLMTDKPAIYRLHVADGVEEKVTDVHFRTSGIYGLWTGPTPDGSPLLLRGRGDADVYALSVAVH